MNATNNTGTDQRRRQLLLGAAALLVQTGVNAQERIPVNLADYGGRPGAAPSVLKDAFEKAYNRLAASGGGELLVPPGVYDFGSHSTAVNIISADDLSDVVISAYGALFKMHTAENVMPCLFYFSNPNNVTVAGASFNDSGYKPAVNWRGMYCVRVKATRKSSGFKMIDCNVESAVGLFSSQSQGINKFLMQDISLHGTVKNAYYGAGLTYVGDNAKVDLTCENVRRGCVAFGLRNANIKIKMSHAAGAPGSNGFIALTCEGESAGNVENVRINLDVSGIESHSGLVHFYHQQKEALGTMRNIDAAVTLNNLKPGSVNANLFVFDHELPSTAILASTARSWDKIFLRGSVTGSFSGRIIHNPSVSTAPGTIYVAPNLATPISMSQLPGYFHVGYPNTNPHP